MQISHNIKSEINMAPLVEILMALLLNVHIRNLMVFLRWVQ